MNDFGLLVAQYNSSLPSLSSTEFTELQVDSSGRLIISGRYLEDSQHASGDAGLFIMGVRNDNDDALTSNNGDYSPLSVDDKGRLKVLADLDVDFDFVYPEDSAFANADLGAYVLAVRQDTLATDTSLDGDYSSFKVNVKGELYVKDSDTLSAIQAITQEEDDPSATGDKGVMALAVRKDAAGSLVSLDGDYAALQEDAEGWLRVVQKDRKEEDTQHASGDFGFMPLAVRKDSAGSLVSLDGDYAPFQVDANGSLRIVGSVTSLPPGSEQYTVTDALVAAGDGLETITAAATPWVTVASFAHASSTAYLYAYQWACDQNAQMRIITDDTADIIVYKTDVNSSAEPGTHESWFESGRIEIAGATDLEIKLQIKKRSATGGDAKGTGSMHIRK